MLELLELLLIVLITRHISASLDLLWRRQHIYSGATRTRPSFCTRSSGVSLVPGSALPTSGSSVALFACSTCGTGIAGVSGVSLITRSARIAGVSRVPLVSGSALGTGVSRVAGVSLSPLWTHRPGTCA